MPRAWTVKTKEPLCYCEIRRFRSWYAGDHNQGIDVGDTVLYHTQVMLKANFTQVAVNLGSNKLCGDYQIWICQD